MRIAFTLTLLAIFIAGMSWCTHSQRSDAYTSIDWRYDDLRLIDPIDVVNVDTEIVAVLSRHTNEILKIRIDFLDLDIEQNFDLYVYIDSKPGGISNAQQSEFRWDYLIQYTNSGLMKLVTDKADDISSTKMRVFKDIIGEFLELTIGMDDQIVNLDSTRFLVSIQVPGSTQIIDQTEAFLINGSPPPPIDISFLFWNILDASTPATILRSWAGAHTGPQSSRHGLYYLLLAADTWNIPVNICGITDRDNKFALRYLQVWPLINNMLHNGLLHSDDYCSDGDLLADQDISFIPNHLLNEPLLFISEIVDSHFSDNTSLIVLGGDFSKSFLGSPDRLPILFSYITSHPWLQVVSPMKNTHLISTMKDSQWNYEIEGSNIPYSITGDLIPSGLSVFEIQSLVMSEFAYLPQNRISTLAKQVYENIIESDQVNIKLARGSYLGQLGHFFQAAYWAENPKEIFSCQQDIDWDGQFECILASMKNFITFELDGGYIAYIFIINSSGVHQLVGPTTQFDVLRSDPSVFTPERGIAGDPGQIIGAFSDQISHLQEYNVNVIEPNHIEFVSHDTSIRKLVFIENETIRVVINHYKEGDGWILKLPLVLDPWRIAEHFTPEIYWYLPLETQWIWGLGDEVSIGISSSTEFISYTFNASYGSLQYPEDPNYNYTLGHILPIPMALVEFQPQSTLVIDLVIGP